MSKPLKPTSIKFTDEQKKFLEILARAQKHNQISKAVKRLVDREMRAA